MSNIKVEVATAPYLGEFVIIEFPNGVILQVFQNGGMPGEETPDPVIYRSNSREEFHSGDSLCKIPTTVK